MADLTKWMEFPSLPHDEHWNISMFTLNSQELMVVWNSTYPTCFNSTKFNVNTNTFTPCFTKAEVSMPQYSVSFHREQQALYIFEDGDNIHSIDIKTNACKSLQPKFTGRGRKIFIDDELHIIAAPDSHWIGTIENDALQTKTINDEPFFYNTVPVRAIPISSKKQIMLINSHYDEPSKTYSSEIYIYSLTTKQWVKKCNNVFPGCITAVLTADQRYIVLLGGRTHLSRADRDIFVLDIQHDNWIVKNCSIKLPWGAECFAAIAAGNDSKNEILAAGWFRECFQNNVFDNLSLRNILNAFVPNITAEFYCSEIIHFIPRSGNCHYGINLNDILSSLCE
eukprot:108207_1